ncbi:unnamed protein product [Vicia faba]|uniref:Uncharacterized protein n=1 Tax=Vicia faba TaxID=3906 RepID=A0AAV0ZZ09_VICFA|nr:unnamed protein product [Vicia faba]
MASETHQEFVKQEKDEAIAEKISSLAAEDGDKPEDAQGQSTPSSTIGDEVKAELVVAEIKKGDDSTALKEFVKPEKDEGIAEKINSLANEDGDKPEDAQGQATPSTTEGDEVKAELAAAEIVKGDDSSALKEFVKQEKDKVIAEKINSLANEDEDKPDDAQGQATPSSATEGDEVKAELAAEAEIVKDDDSSTLKKFVKLKKDEAIEEKINSLANEDGDNPDDAQGQATPTSEAGDEVKAELTAAKIEEGDDSSALKPEKDEAISEKINSLANEDGDKPDDAQSQSTPSSTTEGEEVKAELAAAEIEKGGDSSAVKEFVKPEKDEAIAEKIDSLANEDGENPKDAQGQATPSSMAEGDEVKAELAAAKIEKGDDSSALKEFVKPEKDEAIAEKIDSLANEDGDKSDDAQSQDTPSSMAERDEVKAELASEAIEKGDNSSALKELVKLEKDEAIAEKINSLANEEGGKPNDSQGQATPSSTTEGDEVKAELAAAEIEKVDDSSALMVSVEDSLKPDIIDDAPNPDVEQVDEEKAELAVAEIEKGDESSALKVPVDDSPKPDIVDDAPNSAVEKVDEEKADKLPVAEEKTDNSVPSEPVAVADGVEEEKDLVPESHPISLSEPVLDTAVSQQDEPPLTEPDVKETLQTIEKEPVETAKESQSKTEDVPEAEIIEKSVDTTESSSDATETNHYEVDEVKQAEISETSVEKVFEPVAIEEREVTQEPEKESQEKSEEAEEPSTVAIIEPSGEANEEKTSTEIAEETNNNKVEPTEKVKAESVVTEVEPTETKKELAVAEVEPTGTVKDEPVVTEVEENQKEPEQQSTEPKEEEQSNTASIPEKSAETNDVVVVEEKTRELEFEAAILKDTNNDIAGPTETEKAEPVVTQVEPTETVKEELVVAEVEPTEAVKEEPAVTEIEENQKEPVQQSTEPKGEVQPNTSSIPEQSTETNSAIDVEEKTRELEFEAAILKATNNDNAGPTETEIQSPEKEEEEKPKEASESQEPIGDTVEVHPPKDSDIEGVKEAGNSESEAIPVKEENIDPLSNGVEEKPREQLQIGEEVVGPEKDTEKSEESIDGTIKNSTVKEGESKTNTTVNTEHVSLNDSANPVEPSPEVEEKIVVEDVKKEVVGVTENATSIEEKVDVAAENVKKELEAPDTVQVSSREAEIEIKKAAEQNEAKTATPEAVEANTKVDEISKAVSESVRETLASKFEEKDEEEKTIQTGENNSEKEQIEEPVKTEVEAAKENDTATVSKDLPKETPAKPAQKQSNNLISKVKQSLVKAKKAITGKSPSSKNLSSDQKGDIKVK